MPTFLHPVICFVCHFKYFVSSAPSQCVWASATSRWK